MIRQLAKQRKPVRLEWVPLHTFSGTCEELAAGAQLQRELVSLVDDGRKNA